MKKHLIFLLIILSVISLTNCRSKKDEERKYSRDLEFTGQLIYGAIRSYISSAEAIYVKWHAALVSDQGFNKIKGNSNRYINSEEIERKIEQLKKHLKKFEPHYKKAGELYTLMKKAKKHAEKPHGTPESYRRLTEKIEFDLDRLKREFDLIMLTGREVRLKKEDSSSGEEDQIEQDYSGDPKENRIDQLITQLREDTSLYNRARAARSLGRLKAKRAVPDLMEALEDESWQVHIAAAWALKKITGEDHLMNYKDWKAGKSDY